MSNLTVSEINGELVIDSRLIADELGIHPEILSSTVEKHLTKFQRFGVIRSGTERPRFSSKWDLPEHYYFLNKSQATFLLSLIYSSTKSRNNLEDAFETAKQLKPKTTLGLVKMALEVATEQINLQNQIIASLEHQVLDQAKEFNYSSTLQVAQINKCSENKFSEWILQSAAHSMGIKCLQLGTETFYPNDAWSSVYPTYKLPICR